MGRPKRTPLSPQSQAQANSQRRDNIKWDLKTDEALAHRLSEKYKEWEYGNKVGFCREWAKQMGYGDLDPNGARTKTHIHQLLQKYAVAKDLEKQSGGGTTLVKRKVRGEWKEVEVDLVNQQLEICPLWLILE